MCLESYVWESSSRSGFSNSALSGPRDSTEVPPGHCAVRKELWWVVPAHSCFSQCSSIISFHIFFLLVLHIIFALQKSAANIFQVKFGDHCMRRLIILVYCTSMHWGVFTVLSPAQAKQKASKPFMKVNFKNSYPPPLFKLAEVFSYLMIKNSTSFVKPSPVIGRGEIDPQFAGSLTLPFTSHTIST